MSILDKAKSLIGKNRDKSKDGVDKGAGIADKKTGGAHTDKIDAGADKAKDAIDKLPPQ
ncbi:MAG: antitoxin [Acidimicrobiales bacterium]